jgi:osmotically inducible lipoprotein OsmB
MAKLRLFLVATAVVSLSACLDTDLERGLAGAAVGAVIADATGGNVVNGVLIGGAIGATCDGYTRACN